MQALSQNTHATAFCLRSGPFWLHYVLLKTSDKITATGSGLKRTGQSNRETVVWYWCSTEMSADLLTLAVSLFEPSLSLPLTLQSSFTRVSLFEHELKFSLCSLSPWRNRKNKQANKNKIAQRTKNKERFLKNKYKPELVNDLPLWQKCRWEMWPFEFNFDQGS